MSRAPAPARRDVTMHSHAEPEGRDCKNGCEVLAELGLEAKPRPPSPQPSTRTAHYARQPRRRRLSTSVGVGNSRFIPETV